MRRNRRKNSGFALLILLVLIALVVFGPGLVRFMRGDARRCGWIESWQENYRLSADLRLRDTPSTPAAFILQGAKARAQKAASYNASYRRIPYPNGDIPDDRGSCADVVVRSLRNAGIDLQELIQKDMKQDRSAYPKLWRHAALDPNIDHRRTPNQMCYLSRHWLTLGTSASPGLADNWRPGDLVYWRLWRGVLHCGVVSEKTGPSGLPMVIHNLEVCREEDCLTKWDIIAHFRHPSGSAGVQLSALSE